MSPTTGLLVDLLQIYSSTFNISNPPQHDGVCWKSHIN